MVTEYERAQFDLILLEYKTRGFDISQEPALGSLRVDAIARRGDETIVVELVNSTENTRERASRGASLERLFSDFPNWKLDLRYIDNPGLDAQRAAVGVAVSWDRPIRNQRLIPRKLLKDLKTRRRKSSKEAARAPEYLRVWSYLTQTLRLGQRTWFGGPETSSISETWTALSEADATLSETIEELPDFSQLEDYARIALEGGIIEQESVDCLWKTYLRVHRIVSKRILVQG